MIIPLFTGVSPQPTNVTCVLTNTVCGSSTATVLCSWKVDPARSVIVFNLDLPNGTSIIIPGSQISYSFEHSCQEGGRQDMLIANNCNNNTVIYNLQELISKYKVDMHCKVCIL